jgi:methionyl-tRNA synthetase
VHFSLRNCPAGATPKLVQPLEIANFDALLAPVQPQTSPEPANYITIDEVAKVELKVGTITAAETLPKSKKLLVLQVQIDTATRQIVAGIAEHYTPQQLLGRQVVVVANLKPAKLMGIRSEGMVLAAKLGDTLSLIQPDSPIPAGATVA